MNVLAVDLDSITLNMLQANGILVERCDYGEEFDVEDWCDPTLYAMLLINLDRAGGMYVCRPVRRKNNRIPIIGITPRGDPRDLDGLSFSELRAMFLENGGDDLLPNPLNPRELMASVRAILRRVEDQNLTSVYSLEQDGHRIDVDVARGIVLIDGQRLNMPLTASRLMVMFASRVSRVVTKDQILNYLYADRPNDTPEIKIVDVFICKLRNAINDVVPDLGHKLIATSWGRGYSFEARPWSNNNAQNSTLPNNIENAASV